MDLEKKIALKRLLKAVFISPQGRNIVRNGVLRVKPNLSDQPERLNPKGSKEHAIV